MSEKTTHRSTKSSPKGRKILWGAIAVIIAWFAISGVAGPLFGKLSSVQQNDNAAKNRLTISINFTILTPTKGLEEIKFTSSRFADYDSNEQLVSVENRLIEEINQQIGQDLINKLLSNW